MKDLWISTDLGEGRVLKKFKERLFWSALWALWKLRECKIFKTTYM